MKRSIIATALSLGMALSLCACAGNTGASAQTTAAASTAAQTSTAAQSEAPASEESEADSAERPQLRVGMECAYAPNNWQEDSASDTNWPIENVPGAYAEGYDVQIAERVAGSIGYDLVIVKMSWSGLIEALNQGQIDAIIAGMADTAERRESINFSDPYHRTEYAVMVMSGSPYENAESINDFEGASILGQKDTMYDTVIDQMEGVNHLTPVDSVPNMISRLAQGTCDGIVISANNAESYIKTNPDFVAVRFAEGNGFELGFVGSCVGLRKSDTELLDEVNAALAEISEEERETLWNTAADNQPK